MAEVQVLLKHMYLIIFTSNKPMRLYFNKTDPGVTTSICTNYWTIRTTEWQTKNEDKQEADKQADVDVTWWIMQVQGKTCLK